MNPAARVALVSGFWGQNIGNAFFNIGGRWILEQVFGEGRVAFIQDQPGYRTFHNQSRGNPKQALDLLGHLDVDYLALQGPLLTSSYRALWLNTFRKLNRRGTKIILLGAGFFRYTSDEYSSVRSFLREYPPAVIVTRDSVTHGILSDWGVPAYDGLDSAFFVPRAVPTLNLDLEPFVAMTFDRWPEPEIHIQPTESEGSSFLWDGAWWNLVRPGLLMKLADLGKAHAYLAHLADRRRAPNHVGKYRIIRPEHRSNPHVAWKIYKRSGAIVSDEPFTYASIYSNASLVLTDRVHAAILALAYGNPAMLFTPTPRAALFDRCDLGAIRTHPVRMNLDWLKKEQAAEVDFLEQRVGS